MSPRPPASRRLVALSHTGLHSGAERVLGRLLTAARDAGWDVCCVVPPGPFADALAADGVTVVPGRDLKLGGGPRPLAALLLLLRGLRAARLLRRMPADVVVVNGLLGLPAVRAARLRPPVVWLVHDVVQRRSWKALLTAVAPAVDLAVPVSAAAAAPLRQAGIPTPRVVRNGTQWPGARSAPHPAPRPAVVGCLGLLTPWKGQTVLLEAAAGLPAGVRRGAGWGELPQGRG